MSTAWEPRAGHALLQGLLNSSDGLGLGTEAESDHHETRTSTSRSATQVLHKRVCRRDQGREYAGAYAGEGPSLPRLAPAGELALVPYWKDIRPDPEGRARTRTGTGLLLSEI